MYVIIGFVILKNLLLRYFSARVTIWTLLATALGTNIFFYTTHEAAMAHAGSFFLIILFLWLVDRWYDRQTLLNTLLTGALLGFIALVRPTNILVVFILLLYRVKSWNEFWQRILFFVKKFYLILIMLAGFILPWIPQFLYWHAVTGQFLFYSYGPHGGNFFWGQPHILETLFSFKKGWFIYAPMMGFAMVGLVMLRKRITELFLPLVVFNGGHDLRFKLMVVLVVWGKLWTEGLCGTGRPSCISDGGRFRVCFKEPDEEVPDRRENTCVIFYFPATVSDLSVQE